MLADRDRPQLTWLSALCQVGERRELDRLAAQLPGTTSVRGFLGDAILVCSREPWNVAAYLAKMEAAGVIADEKRFPADLDEYLRWFAGHTSVQLDITPLTDREIRRESSRRYATLSLGSSFEPL